MTTVDSLVGAQFEPVEIPSVAPTLAAEGESTDEALTVLYVLPETPVASTRDEEAPTAPNCDAWILGLAPMPVVEELPPPTPMAPTIQEHRPVIAEGAPLPDMIEITLEPSPEGFQVALANLNQEVQPLFVNEGPVQFESLTAQTSEPSVTLPSLENVVLEPVPEPPTPERMEVPEYLSPEPMVRAVLPPPVELPLVTPLHAHEWNEPTISSPPPSPAVSQFPPPPVQPSIPVHMPMVATFPHVAPAPPAHAKTVLPPPVYHRPVAAGPSVLPNPLQWPAPQQSPPQSTDAPVPQWVAPVMPTEGSFVSAPTALELPAVAAPLPAAVRDKLAEAAEAAAKWANSQALQTPSPATDHITLRPMPRTKPALGNDDVIVPRRSAVFGQPLPTSAIESDVCAPADKQRHVVPLAPAAEPPSSEPKNWLNFWK